MECPNIVNLIVEKIKQHKNRDQVYRDKVACLVAKIAKAQKELKRYEAFWNNAQEAFLLLKAPHGNIIDANPAAYVLYGYTKEDILTKTIYDLSDEPECTRQVYESRATSVPFRYHKNADGRRFLISCNLTFFQDNGNGEIAALVVRPITEQRVTNGEVKDRRIVK
jgi:PAS domain S-box-containing protein